MRGEPDLIRRQRAIERVIAKYRGRPLDFRSADCVRMARTHLVAMGHRPPPLPRYASAAGALRALRKAGFETMEALFDSLLPRIPWSRALPGDILLISGDPEGLDGAALDAVAISLGNKAMGWHGAMDRFERRIVPLAVKAAFRA